MGRKAIQGQAMTNAERQARYRQQQKSNDKLSIVPNETKNENIAELVDYCITLEQEIEESETRYNNLVNRMNYLLREAIEPCGMKLHIQDDDIVFSSYGRDSKDCDNVIGCSSYSIVQDKFYFSDLINNKFIRHEEAINSWKAFESDLKSLKDEKKRKEEEFKTNPQYKYERTIISPDGKIHKV